MGSWHRSFFPFLCALASVFVITGCGNETSHAPKLADEYTDGSSFYGSGGASGRGGVGGSGQADASEERQGDDAQAGDAKRDGATSDARREEFDARGAESVDAALDAPSGPGCAEGGAPTTEQCSDGIDNDCNGLTDCMDPICKPSAVAGLGPACDTSGRKCDWHGACVCPSGNTSETLCGDKTDNDCDGLTDCDDPDCQPGGVSATFACDGAGHTCGARNDAGQTFCTTCAGGKGSETACANHIDDDCDGKQDCEDNDCLGQQCGLSSSQVCIGTTCVDLDNAYSVKLTPERLAIPADGVARDPIAIVLANTSTGPIADQLVDLKISGSGSWYGYTASDGGAAATNIRVRTDSTGKATATFLSDAGGGTGDISAILVGANTGTTVSIDMPVVDTMKVLGMDNTLMGVFGSGFNEENHVTYQLLAPNGVNYPKGLTVTFTHESLHGSALGPPKQDPVPPPGGGTPVSTVTGTTDSEGKVTLTVYSGTEAGTASVVASTMAAGQTRSLLVSDIVIVGAKASGARGRMILTCAKGNLSAFASLDCPNSNWSDAATCTVSAADRFGNVLGVAKSVTFLSEAGTMGPPASTPAYPNKDLLGTAGTALKAIGPLPRDVEPFADEPRIHGNWLCNQERTHNPRDGIVTVIASMQGEEGFRDSNKNGKWDAGEPFIDLPEPFVDVNDDNEYSIDEPYTDTNMNGQWDGPNGKWDANTTIWVQTRVAFTSGASGVLSGYGSPPPNSLDGGTPLPTDPGLPPTITLKEAVAVDYFFTDINFNALPPPPASSTESGTLYTAEAHGAAATSSFTPVIGTIPHGFDSGIKYCVAAPAGGYLCDDDCYVGPICTVRSFIGNYTPYATGTVWLPTGAVGLSQLRTTATVANTALKLDLGYEVTPP